MTNRFLPKPTRKTINAMTESMQEQINEADIFCASVIAKARHEILVDYFSDLKLDSKEKTKIAKELYAKVQIELEAVGKISSENRSSYISRKNAYRAYTR